MTIVGSTPPELKVTAWSLTEGYSLKEGYDMCLNKVLWALEKGMTDSHGALAKASQRRQYRRTHRILPNKGAVGLSRVRTSWRGGTCSMWEWASGPPVWQSLGQERPEWWYGEKWKGEMEGPGLPVFCKWESGSQDGFKERKDKNSGCEEPDWGGKPASY